jgi:predicted small integral membrane protein
MRPHPTLRSLGRWATAAAPLTLLAAPARAQQAGWGNVGQQAEEAGFDWTQPLFGGFWMAWTPATLAVFAGIFAAMGVLTVIEARHPGGAPRDGVLGLTTTRGDRLFLSLLGSAFIFLGWLGLVGQPVWGALGLSVAWSAFCFWKV